MIGDMLILGRLLDLLVKFLVFVFREDNLIMDGLPVTAGRDDIEAYLKKQHEGSDFEITKEHVDDVMTALQSNRSWRESLDPLSQIQMSQVAGIHPPHDPDNPPIGVTVVDRGKERDRGEERVY